MNQPRNPEHTTRRQITLAKTVKKLDSKLQRQPQGWSKISNKARKNTAKRSKKFATTKFKCTGKHVLGHDWLIKIT